MLSLMSPRQQEAFQLVSQGMTRSQAAEVMGIEASRVKNLLNEGRRRVRRTRPDMPPHPQATKPTRLRTMQMSVLAGSTI